MRRSHRAGSLLALACAAAAGAPDPRMLGAAGYAKIVCSAVIVSGRAVEEARRNSTYFLATDEDRAAVSTVDVDRVRREVRVTVRGGGSRRARHLGDQGCVIVPDGGEIRFQPVPVRTALPDAATQPWPMGDAPDGTPWPTDVDRRSIDAAVARAFADPEALTAAFVVVHRGRILAERPARPRRARAFVAASSFKRGGTRRAMSPRDARPRARRRSRWPCGAAGSIDCSASAAAGTARPRACA